MLTPAIEELVNAREGLISRCSEHGQRSFYGYWARLMSAENGGNGHGR